MAGDRGSRIKRKYALLEGNEWQSADSNLEDISAVDIPYTFRDTNKRWPQQKGLVTKML